MVAELGAAVSESRFKVDLVLTRFARRGSQAFLPGGCPGGGPAKQPLSGLHAFLSCRAHLIFLIDKSSSGPRLSLCPFCAACSSRFLVPTCQLPAPLPSSDRGRELDWGICLPLTLFVLLSSLLYRGGSAAPPLACCSTFRYQGDLRAAFVQRRPFLHSSSGHFLKSTWVLPSEVTHRIDLRLGYHPFHVLAQQIPQPFIPPGFFV